MTEKIHERFDRSEPAKGSSDAAFGFVFTVVFLVLGLSPLRKGLPPRIWFLLASALTLSLALSFSGLLAPFNRLWTRLAFLIGTVTTPLVLGIVFFGVFSLVGAVLSLFGVDLLGLKSGSGEETFWMPRCPPGPAPESMRRMF
jgi:hypothetical protein